MRCRFRTASRGSVACGIRRFDLRRSNYEPLTYCSCYVYSPRGPGPAAEASRLLRRRLKAADVDWLPRYVTRVRQLQRETGIYAGLFGEDVILVPVPGCRSESSASPWVADQLATVMQEAGLGGSVWRGLQRVVTIPKSASAPVWQRPFVHQHYTSTNVATDLPDAGKFVIVDDVISKGRTLLGVAQRLREALPRSQVQAFALLRTMSLVADIGQLVAPCRGEIRWHAFDALRDP